MTTGEWIVVMLIVVVPWAALLSYVQVDRWRRRRRRARRGGLVELRPQRSAPTQPPSNSQRLLRQRPDRW